MTLIEETLMRSKKNVIYFITAILLLPNMSLALQRKSIESINSDELTSDTQIEAPCGDDHFNLIWWIPIEFWDSIFTADQTISATDRENIINTLTPYSILGVCQADISDFGAFSFYGKSEIQTTLEILYTDNKDQTFALRPTEEVDPDVNLMLNMMKPVLTAAMGNMGENFHFYVLSDKTELNKRKVDPFEAGSLRFTLGRRDKTCLQASLDFPLNSLYVPRKCPNGKNAHVSWNYCPWTGKKLTD